MEISYAIGNAITNKPTGSARHIQHFTRAVAGSASEVEAELTYKLSRRKKEN